MRFYATDATRVRRVELHPPRAGASSRQRCALPCLILSVALSCSHAHSTLHRLTVRVLGARPQTGHRLTRGRLRRPPSPPPAVHAAGRRLPRRGWTAPFSTGLAAVNTARRSVHTARSRATRSARARRLGRAQLSRARLGRLGLVALSAQWSSRVLYSDQCRFERRLRLSTVV